MFQWGKTEGKFISNESKSCLQMGQNFISKGEEDYFKADHLL